MFSTTRKCHLRTCFCTGARIARHDFEKRVSVHTQPNVWCVYTQGGSVFVRTQGRRRRRLRVCFHGYRRRGTRAFNPTSMMMRGGSRGVVEEGAGRRRIKSSKSFYLSTLSSSFALFFLRSLSFFIYSTLITSLHRVAFSRSLCSFDKKS